MTDLSARKSPACLAFDVYLRTGLRVPESVFEARLRALETKFNPYHDPQNGQFTFAPGGGGGGGEKAYVGITVNGRSVIKATSGGHFNGASQWVPEQFPPDPYALTSPAAALAHYLGGSGEERNYYFNNVDTSAVRISNFSSIASLAVGGEPGSYAIVDAIDGYNGDFLGTGNLSSWATVGGLRLRANGTLVISEDGAYSFSGNLSADPDKYDFNIRAGRSGAADGLTAIGRLLPGKAFMINLIGSKPFQAQGRP